MLGKSLVTLCFFSIISLCLCEVPIRGYVPCKQTDGPCLENAGKVIIGKVFEGIPEVGIDSQDPMYFEIVVAIVAGLKYKVSKVYVTGFKNCDIRNVKLDLPKSNLKFDLFCVLEFKGDYVMNGRLIDLPVDGDGTFFIKTGKISLPVNYELSQVKGKDGKYHFNVKKFTVDVIALDNDTRFYFKNLFNGDKQLSDGVHNFANSNSQQIINEISGPIFTETTEILTKNLNKFYKAVPADELLDLSP